MMRMFRLLAPILIAAGAALFALPAIAAPPRSPSHSRTDWNATVRVTPLGSHVTGNPAAKVKLVEYVSYTCPHCAVFQTLSEAPLRLRYVQPGLVSVEVRNLLRDPIDLAVAMLTNCGDPAKFPANHSLFLRTQSSWMQALERANDTQRHSWDEGAIDARLKAIARDFGLIRMMVARGYKPAALDRCLGDAAMMQRLSKTSEDASVLGVNSTPNFLLDGTLLAGTYDWPGLEEKLKQRL